MAEYIEREALLERIDSIWDCADMVFEPNDHCCRADDCASCKWAETKKAIRKIVANFPAADVRPVVLCKDCKYCLIEDEWEYWCNGFCSPARLVRKDDFCSHGCKNE